MDITQPLRNQKYSILSEPDVLFLKKYLDSGWFKEFKRRYEKKYGKGTCVAYTTAINVLNGRTKNFKVLELINTLTEENQAIENSIKSLKNKCN